MADQIEVKKAKTHKGRLHLQSKIPKVIEGPKESIFLNTHNTSDIMKMVLNDLVRKIFKLLF